MMLILTACFNFVRKKYVLGLIFSVSAIYCLVSLIREQSKENISKYELNPLSKENRIKWYSLSKDEDKLISGKGMTTGKKRLFTCRNSVQGRLLIADDKGYVCSRSDRLSSGCCNIKSPQTKRFVCDTCESNQCCATYEYCISCCLHPNKKSLLQKGLVKTPNKLSLLFASVTDHFELCLFKCRTSSQSVKHENSYRNPKVKHCYGNHQPIIKHSNNL